MKHPDLFDQPKAIARTNALPMAEVIAFPLNRDVGRVRRMATAILRRKSPEAQQAQFERDALSLGRKLRRAGLGEAEVAHQIDALTAAINRELARQQNGRHQA